jgi:hypothetical protein
MPDVLSRRHVPLDSPNCTREFGPTDATIRALLLGPARTTTQPFATDATHRDAVRDLADGGVDAAVAGCFSRVDDDVTGCGGVAGGGGTSGETTGGTMVGATESRSTVPLLTIVIRGVIESTGVTPATAVSASDLL